MGCKAVTQMPFSAFASKCRVPGNAEPEERTDLIGRKSLFIGVFNSAFPGCSFLIPAIPQGPERTFMINRFQWNNVKGSRYRCGPIGPIGPRLDGFAALLSEQGYSKQFGMQKIRVVRLLSLWMARSRLG